MGKIYTQTEPMFTESETAAMLRMSLSKLRRIRKGRSISHFRFNNRVFYGASHVEAYRRKNEVAAAA